MKVTRNAQFRSNPNVKKIMKQHRDGTFLFYVILTLVGLTAGFLAPVFLDLPWWGTALSAANVGFWSTQTAFLGHDVGHNQALSRWPKMNYAARIIIGCILLGFSIDWWVKKHNEHHKFPNVIKSDPDTEIKLLGFTIDQARSRPAIYQTLIKVQHFLLWFYMPFQAVNAQHSSWEYLSQEQPEHRDLQRYLIRTHMLLGIAYLIFLGFHLGLSDSLVFGAVYLGVFGFYNSMVFAPNHKGMMTYTLANMPEFLILQVTTARNVRGNWVVDFLMGGLNYQQEHHVDSATSRWNLKKLRPYLKDFCAQHEIAKIEVSWFRAIWDIFTHLREVALELRADPMG